ncbi:MAG: FtsX-like permease family protein [Polyangiaceae bacterium]|jgi:putative ABC transport system permease protein|nr:FtsX-like permease family protein [Polyangiaceae bacterium]
MTGATLALRNVWRNRFRAALTALGVAVTVLTFVLLRTIIWAYTMGAEVAAKDRVVTRHKITFVMPLPKRYADSVRAEPGVTRATWANWFGGKDPKHENEFFSTLAVDPKTYFEVYDEMRLPAGQLEAFQQDRRGAIVGDVIARKLGWKVGDKVSLASQIFPGDWEFHVVGIYEATRKSVDRSQFIFHFDYLNESLPVARRDQIGWVISRVSDPGRTADIGRAIDQTFDEKDVQTISQSEGAFNASFLGMFSAVLRAIDVVSLAILLVMMLILGNTVAMGVRERTHEYGTMRAIGFLPRHVAWLVFGEALATGAIGGLLGLALAYPIVEKGMGRYIEENMGGFFPYFQIAPATAALALGLALALGALAALVPAYQASRLNVVDALRRVA